MNAEQEDRLVVALEKIADFLGKISERLALSPITKNRATIGDMAREVAFTLQGSERHLRVIAKANRQKECFTLDEAAKELGVTIRTLQKHLGNHPDKPGKPSEIFAHDLERIRWSIRASQAKRASNLRKSAPKKRRKKRRSKYS